MSTYQWHGGEEPWAREPECHSPRGSPSRPCTCTWSNASRTPSTGRQGDSGPGKGRSMREGRNYGPGGQAGPAKPGPISRPGRGGGSTPGWVIQQTVRPSEGDGEGRASKRHTGLPQRTAAPVGTVLWQPKREGRPGIEAMRGAEKPLCARNG